MRKTTSIGTNHKSQTKNLTKSIYEIKTYGDLWLQKKTAPKINLGLCWIP